VARKLQDAGLIRYRGGRIQVLDIEGLQGSCCECYAAINAHFHRLVGWSPDAATRQRDIEFLLFTARCRILDEPNCSPLRWKTGASDGFRHVEN
jgi:hypothetical protein